MSYASEKGAAGEREFASFLNNVFHDHGFSFMRIGGTERNKKVLHGDVVLDTRTDKNGFCVLKHYFLEAKKRKTINLWDVLEQTEKKADELYKHGSIIYAIRQGEGKKRDGVVIAMTPKTFKSIMQDYQAYRSSDAN